MHDFQGSVSLDTLSAIWDSFFYAPESPATLALFRIAFGALLLADALFHLKDCRLYLAPDGILDFKTWRTHYNARLFSLLAVLPPSLASVRALLAVHFLAIFGLIAGWALPFCAVIVFVTLSSLQHRNPFIINSGDVAMKMMAFFFIFASFSADMFSVDALRHGAPSTASEPWSLRLLQVLVATIYFKSMYWKLLGATWRNGTAVFYVLNVKRYQRRPFPAVLRTPLIYKTLSWATLVIWGALAMLVWIDELRYPVMAVGVVFHLGMDIFLRIRMFQWVMMTGLVLFIRPADAQMMLNGLNTFAQRFI